MGLDATFYIIQRFYGEEAKELASKMHFYKYVDEDLGIQIQTPFLHLRNNWPVQEYIFHETGDHDTITIDMYYIKDMYRDVQEAMNSYDDEDFDDMGFEEPDGQYDDFYYSKLKELRDGLKELLEIYNKAEHKEHFYTRYTYW